MKQNQKINRQLLLFLGIAVGILIFVLSTQKTQTFSQVEKTEFQQNRTIKTIIKSFSIS